jgi:deazaflavin-dependent oxidoreductase (nitroreductase family)
VAWLTARGHRTGLLRGVAVGFIAEPDGSILIAANGPDQAWGRNLQTDPSVIVEIGDDRYAATAESLDDADHARAVRELILRYGTPSEGLGSGPSFRLRRVVEERA